MSDAAWRLNQNPKDRELWWEFWEISTRYVKGTRMRWGCWYRGWLLKQLKIKIIWESLLCNTLFMWLVTTGSFIKRISDLRRNDWKHNFQTCLVKTWFKSPTAAFPHPCSGFLFPGPQFEPNGHAAAFHAHYKAGSFWYSFTCPCISLWFSW